jgi:hypothetical protein
VACKVAAWSMGNSLAWCCVTHSGPTDITECLCHCSSEWSAPRTSKEILSAQIKKWRGQLLLDGLGTNLVVVKSVYLAYFLPVPDIFRIAIMSIFTLADTHVSHWKYGGWDTCCYSVGRDTGLC